MENGEYNLDCFKYKDEKLSVGMLHQGYEGIYEKIEMIDLETKNTKVQ